MAEILAVFDNFNKAISAYKAPLRKGTLTIHTIKYSSKQSTVGSDLAATLDTAKGSRASGGDYGEEPDSNTIEDPQSFEGNESDVPHDEYTSAPPVERIPNPS